MKLGPTKLGSEVELKRRDWVCVGKKICPSKCFSLEDQFFDFMVKEIVWFDFYGKNKLLAAW